MPNDSEAKRTRTVDEVREWAEHTRSMQRSTKDDLWTALDEVERQDVRLVVAEALLDCFQRFFDGPCRLDHNGACQAHMGEDDGCTVAEARQWIAEVRKPCT